jgi:protein O-mannosyl-transferase
MDVRRISPAWAIPGSLVLLGLLVYAPILPGYFLADDFHLLAKSWIEGWYLTWGPRAGGFFRPLTALSHSLDLRVWGTSSWGHHAVSVVLHAVNAWLVFRVGRSWLRFFHVPEAPAAQVSLAAAVLFLVLPNHTEAVTYIGSRGDVLAAAWGLFSLWFALDHLQRPRPLTLAGSLAGLACALLSKESALGLIPVLVGMALLKTTDPRIPAKNRAAGYALLRGVIGVLLVYLGMRWATLGTLVGGYGTGLHLKIFSFSTLGNLVLYGLRSWVPALPVAWQPVLTAWGIGNAVAVLLAVLALALFPFRRLPAPARSELWLGASLLAAFLSALVPVLGFRVEIFSPMNERLLYLPSAFACLAFVSGVYALLRPRRVWRSLLLGLCLIYALLLQFVNARWIVAGSLTRQILASTPLDTGRTRLIVLNLPSEYRGAYVFRLGFQSGLDFFLKSDLAGRLLAAQKLPALQRLNAVNTELQRWKEHPPSGPSPDTGSIQARMAERDRLLQMPEMPAYLEDVRKFIALQTMKEINVLSIHSLFTKDDEVVPHVDEERITLELRTPWTAFDPPSPQGPGSGRQTAPGRVEFLRSTLPQDAEILYYSRGRLHRLDLTPTAP